MDERLARRPDAIRTMFSGVSRRYDFLNRVLSLRRDVAWRHELVAALVVAPAGAVLDVAAGTGDVALAVRDRFAVGADFCLEMLALALRKGARQKERAAWVGADALALPFRERSFAAVTVAFGMRNFVDVDAGLAEMRRVLVPGGVLAVLEFQRPTRAAPRFAAAAWDRLVVTPLGRLLSDEGDAYSYLPASVTTFPAAAALGERIRAAGFSAGAPRELSGGIAALTVARREEGP